MPNYWNKLIVYYRKLLITAFGGCCQAIKENGEICGSTERLEFAHLEPTELNGWGRGRKERVYDVIRYPWKYQLFCHDCHFLYDHKKKDVDEHQVSSSSSDSSANLSSVN